MTTKYYIWKKHRDHGGFPYTITRDNTHPKVWWTGDIVTVSMTRWGARRAIRKDQRNRRHYPAGIERVEIVE